MRVQLTFCLLACALLGVSGGSPKRKELEGKLETFPKFLMNRVDEIAGATAETAKELEKIFSLVKSELTAMDGQLLGKDADLAKKEKEIASLKKEIEKRDAMIKQLEGGIRACKSREAGYLETIKKVTAENDKLKKDSAQCKKDLSASKETIKAQEEKIKFLEEQLKKCNRSPGKDWELVGGRYIKLYDVKMKWTDAQATCQKAGAQLLTVRGDAFKATTQWLIKNKKIEMWIGASDQKEEGKWLWVDSTPVDKEKGWEPGEPDSGLGLIDEDCAMANYQGNLWDHPGQWIDYGCDHKKSFVCEVPRRFGVVGY